MDEILKHSMVSVNGVHLHVVTAGPENGTPVVLLHGFPEYWYGWKRQIQPLVNRGYYVILPDQRGYNLSDKPAGLDAYRADRLAADVVGLIQALGYDKAAVIGHDWGGVIAWVTAVLFPQSVERLLVMDAPYLSVAFRSFWRHPQQLMKSYYMFLFQLPKIAEKLLSKDHFAAMVASMEKTSPPGTFLDDDFIGYRAAWTQAGAMTGMLNWYRALFRLPFRLPTKPVLQMPVLIIWGGKDFALGRYLAEESLKLCPNGELVILEEANHWVQHEQADRVNHLMLEFLGKPGHS